MWRPSGSINAKACCPSRKGPTAASGVMARPTWRASASSSPQRLGFSLDEVAGLLMLDDGTHCDEARELAEQKLRDVRGKLADLQRIESVLVLAALVHDCCASHGTVSCPLIAALQ